jgi:hypothetical protein
MKKKVLLFLIGILFINLVSAAYDCSGTLVADESLINVEQIKSINKVNIALLDSSVGKAAEILISAKSLTLSSGVPSVNTTLPSGYHEINLTSISNSIALIEIDNGTEGDVEVRAVKEIGNLKFYALSIATDVKFFVGDGYLFLYEANPSAIKKIGSTEYLFEITSSDSSGAIISVKKCSNGDFTEVNEPANPEINESLLQNKSLTEENITIPENVTSSESLKDKSVPQGLYPISIITVSVIIVFVISVILYRLHKRKKERFSDEGNI